MDVRTTATADPGPLVGLVSPEHPLAFIRGGEGIVGFGEALRLAFSGPTRFTDAAAAWRSLVASANVVDEVGMPGSGLTAFGSFAYSPRSASTSVLVVPRVMVGRRDGQCWITRIDDAELPVALLNAPPSTRSPSAESSRGCDVRFSPGHMSLQAYTAAVARAILQIRTGDLRKVVIARDLVGALPPHADLQVPLANLARAYPDTFTFAVEGLLGSSPETLVRVSGSTVTARVLAGSAARGSDAGLADAPRDAAARKEFSTSSKDLAEHSFAIASVMDALAPRTTGLGTSEPFPLALPNLFHLASDVTGTLTDDASALDLLAVLHPTAAVAGSPTEAAIAFIDSVEPFDRGRYAGPVGWVNGNGDGEWAVALRCAQVSGPEVRAFAGAGIVADSDPARELAETALKFSPITRAFGR